MKRHIWTTYEVALVVELYPNTPTIDISERIGVSLARLYSKAQQLGLHKSAQFLASPASCRLRPGERRSSATMFKQGMTPWNKGLKGLTLGGRETQFKPGHLSGRAREIKKPIGTERITRDGYLERKINDDLPFNRRWRGVHLIVWESAHGPVPKGHAVVFKDGDRQNVDPDNLELISRVDLMRRNSYHQYGPEIAQLVQLRGAVTRQINRRINA